MRFSIILPLCNEEKLLPGCMGPLLACQEPDLEILLVDRGSADGTEMLCQGYRAAYPDRVRVLRLPGGTVGQARNLAIDQARGDYLLFTDCASPLRTEALAALSRESGADLYLTGGQGKHLPRRYTLEQHPELLLEEPDVRALVWGRQLFDDAYLRFPEPEGYDDLRMTCKALALSRTMGALPAELCWEKSPAPVPDAGRELALLDALDDIQAYFRRRGMQESFRDSLTGLACGQVCGLAFRVLQNRGDRESLTEAVRYLDRCFPDWASRQLPAWRGQDPRRVLGLVRQGKWTRLSVLFLMKRLA